MSSGKNRPGNQSGASKGKASSTRTLSSSAGAAPANSSHRPGVRIHTSPWLLLISAFWRLLFLVTGSKSTSDEEVTIYVDLAYIPSGVSSSTVGVDFFRCIRSSCYVVSGDSPEREELLAHTLNALLDSKTFWPDGTQVQTEWFLFSVAHYVVIFLNVLSASSRSVRPGDGDPHLWVGADAGVVPADRGQTEGAGHHRAGIQQHRRHARRNLPGLQDRVLKNQKNLS